MYYRTTGGMSDAADSQTIPKSGCSNLCAKEDNPLTKYAKKQIEEIGDNLKDMHSCL